jgi:hypothetical protein
MMVRARARGRFEVPADLDTEGMLWADIWINICFVLFVVVSDPATKSILSGADLSTAGGRAAKSAVVQLYLGTEQAPTLRLGSPTGTIVADLEALKATVTEAYGKDPGTIFRLVVPGTTPAATLLASTRELELSGVKAIKVDLKREGS